MDKKRRKEKMKEFESGGEICEATGAPNVKERERKEKKEKDDFDPRATHSQKNLEDHVKILDDVKKLKHRREKKKRKEYTEIENGDVEACMMSENKSLSNEKTEHQVAIATESPVNARKLSKVKEHRKQKFTNLQSDDVGIDISSRKRYLNDGHRKHKALNSTEGAADVHKASKVEKKKRKRENEEPRKNINAGVESQIDGECVKEAENSCFKKEKPKKKRRKKKQPSEEPRVESSTPNRSARKVTFADDVEILSSSNGIDAVEDNGKDNGLVRGKRFSKEEDAIIEAAVMEYIESRGLGDKGIDMVMHCVSHPELRDCWKEIGASIPWRPQQSVYYRAHILFERSEKRAWTTEEIEQVRRFAEKHGRSWRTLGDAIGKHRLHVKDAWRRIRLENMKKGKWSREEYQMLFDLVNVDLRMKAFEEKKSKHGMLRDNIPWTAISDKLGTRKESYCCEKWYNQLTSPMVAKGVWNNVDDYLMIDTLSKLDATCIEDVDWDNLLEDRSGDICRKRWNQMVLHIGLPGSKSFSEQVEILSMRYCADLAEVRKEFDSRPAVT